MTVTSDFACSTLLVWLQSPMVACKQQMNPTFRFASGMPSVYLCMLLSRKAMYTPLPLDPDLTEGTVTMLTGTDCNLQNVC